MNSLLVAGNSVDGSRAVAVASSSSSTSVVCEGAGGHLLVCIVCVARSVGLGGDGGYVLSYTCMHSVCNPATNSRIQPIPLAKSVSLAKIPLKPE